MTPEPHASAPAADREHAAATPAPDPLAESTALALTDADDEAGEPLLYDPADYRWVPVRRRPRLDGWTEEKQRRFIETLADTGLVALAATEVGMSRASAYQLRRAAHGAAFARAWDAARHHAAGLIEDIAFERAIEGSEQDVYNHRGEVVGTRVVHDNRLLKYLLSHLKPERYGTARAPAAAASAAPPAEAAAPALADSLRAMEPALPAPADQLLDADTLAHELNIAEVADGVLPHFLREQRPPKSAARQAAEDAAAIEKRCLAAIGKFNSGEDMTDEEFADACYYLDPASNPPPKLRPRRGRR
ncbi:hypothetical protein GO308_11850 [Sphingomonas sp. SFZ2018-12]|uniref:hypothetical protein n=6 Tax=Sphingomonas TaxID=13687 RepID=UPI001F0EC082|nr:hypothetical protein [Sphingomonas sp. SFZ2018-12]MCH4893806.1 hypothetical protein [Sphingomonas sp. SFZ2018-12]